MLNVNPASGRLYGVMQSLLAAYAQKRVAPPAPPRGVVEEQDALDAVMNLAATLDKNLQEGALPQNDAAHMAALLMLVRDYIRPLPEARVERGGQEVDGVSADLREFVDALRSGRAASGMRG